MDFRWLCEHPVLFLWAQKTTVCVKRFLPVDCSTRIDLQFMFFMFFHVNTK